MPELSDHAGPVQHPPGPEQGHEPPDVSVRNVLITAAVLVAVAVVAHLALWGHFDLLTAREDQAQEGLPPLAVEEGELPLDKRLDKLGERQPLLEGFERVEGRTSDIHPEDLRASRQPRLQGYGPAEPPEEGYARIPIDRAMRLLVEKNLLPARKDKNTSPKR